MQFEQRFYRLVFFLRFNFTAVANFLSACRMLFSAQARPLQVHLEEQDGAELGQA